MDLKDIQNLIKFVAKSGASEVKLEMEDVKVTIKTGSDKVETRVVQQAPVQLAPPAIPAAPTQGSATEAVTPAVAEKDEDSNLIIIKSPIIGTFYRRSAPDKPLFVEVGNTIKKGDTVCIIEAMTLFNEIESEVSGKVVKILVEDSSPVEFDQPLFLVDPS